MRTKQLPPTAIIAPSAVLGAGALTLAGFYGVGALGQNPAVGTAALPMAAVVAALVAAFAYLWPRLLGLSGAWRVTGLILAAGWAAILAAVMTPLPNPLQWFPIIVGAGVLATFLVQLMRGTGASGRLDATLGSLAGVVIAALGSGWVGVVITTPISGSALTVPIASGLVALAALGLLFVLARRLPTGAGWSIATLALAPLLAAGSVTYFLARLLFS